MSARRSSPRSVTWQGTNSLSDPNKLETAHLLCMDLGRAVRPAPLLTTMTRAGFREAARRPRPRHRPRRRRRRRPRPRPRRRPRRPRRRRPRRHRHRHRQALGSCQVNGEISLTPDHVLLVDGQWASARAVKVSSSLSGSMVTADSKGHAGIINPLTTNGLIVAAGPSGKPVVASAYPEWIATYMHMLNVVVFPLPVSLSNLSRSSSSQPPSRPTTNCTSRASSWATRRTYARGSATCRPC